MKCTAVRLLFALLATLSAAGSPLAAGDVEVDGSFVSKAATGTPPLEVTSTTRVDNLNADLLDDLDSSDLFTTATDGTGSGLDADLLDGLDASAFARSLGNVVRVGKTGGDFASIQAALDSITTASAGNPYLVWVGPGIYEERVVMKPFVDIRGAGEGVTRISDEAGAYDSELGTVVGADDAELRFLTVEHSGGPSPAIGVYNLDVSPRLVHVTVEVNGAATTVAGIVNDARGGTPTAPELDHVTVLVTGADILAGIRNLRDANTRMRHVRVEVRGTSLAGSFGVVNDDAVPLLDDVEVSVTSEGASAEVVGLVNYMASGALVRGVRVEVTAGGTRYGVDNRLSDLTLRDLAVTVFGDGSASYGVSNQQGTVVLESCSIDAGGDSSTTAGVYFSDASGELRDCAVKASGGTGFRAAIQGLDSTAGTTTQTIDVQHSRLSGPDAAISAPDAYTVQVGASQLDGGVAGGAPYLCVFAYDGSFAALGAACV